VQTRVVHITAKHHHDDPKKEWVVKIQSQSFKMEMPVIIFPKITSKNNPKKHTRTIPTIHSFTIDIHMQHQQTKTHVAKTTANENQPPE
jgi:hypothetical protein